MAAACPDGGSWCLRLCLTYNVCHMGVMKETQKHERRVALVPSVEAKPIKLGAKLVHREIVIA